MIQVDVLSFRYIALLLSACLLPAWNYLHASSYLVFLCSVLRNGKTFGIVLQTTNFMRSTQLLSHRATITSLHAVKL